MKRLVNKQRQFFYTGQTNDYAFRKKQLETLKSMLQTYEVDIFDALKKDLNKSKHETLTTELGVLYSEINFALNHLKKWMKQKVVPTPLTHKGTSNYVMYEPYGVTLLISPWNYPVQLALAPAIGAMAAGNTIILKPSELTPHTSNLLNEMIVQTFAESYFTVVVGGKAISDQLLNERVDYIFFTGSTHVGKIVMEKASKHLTPLTLELGGKSPAIVDKECHIKFSAKRLVWGKFTNAGQTCVAPDYVYVHEHIYENFLKEMKKQISVMYGKKLFKNKDYVRIVNKSQFKRLINLIDHNKVTYGGTYDERTLTITPTILENISWDDPVMQDEIFGPILPIMPFHKLEEIIPIIREREKPLALYYFGSSKKKEAKVLNLLSFGGGCINDTLYHLANPHLPFGGVGQSGMGSYHGEYSFQTFSHQKSILKQTTKFDIPVRYPGSKIAHAVAKRLFR